MKPQQTNGIINYQPQLRTGWSLSSQHGRMAKQRHQALQDLYSSVQEVGGIFFEKTTAFSSFKMFLDMIF